VFGLDHTTAPKRRAKRSRTQLSRATGQFSLTVPPRFEPRKPPSRGRGPAWRRDCGIEPGDTVDVLLAPEGPQRTDLAPDVTAALEAEAEAGVFFDSLAQFYGAPTCVASTAPSADRR
jgi:hypothetical protein